MAKKLKWTYYLSIGSMLFGLFFGAGNLIFPVFMGQQAGFNVTGALIGFTITAVVLPFLGVVALGLSRVDGLFDLSSKVHPYFAYFFTIALYLTIGPLFALPRLATVSYEVAFTPFVPADQNWLGLAIFSVLFYAAAIAFALNPTRIVGLIGNFLNPIFMVAFGLLLIAAVLNPMGSLGAVAPTAEYAQNSFFIGFIEGYNTMDALASLAFGLIVINALKRMGVTQPKQIAVDTIKSGIITVVLLTVIYGALAFLGALSVNEIGILDNGGLALAAISQYYFGEVGNILLAIMITVACMTTAIGLISACSEIFVKMFPNSFTYRTYVFIFGIMTALIANIGLNAIISYALPVLMLLYPLAITLIIMALIAPFMGDRRISYVTSILFVFPVAIADFIASAVDVGIAPRALTAYSDFVYSLVPFTEVGMGWVLPAVIGIALGLVLAKVTTGPNLGDLSQEYDVDLE